MILLYALDYNGSNEARMLWVYSISYRISLGYHEEYLLFQEELYERNATGKVASFSGHLQ